MNNLSLQSLGIGILTCKGWDEYKTCDLAIINELNKRHIQAEHVVWNDPSVNWSKYQVILVLSTWDYFQSAEIFNYFLKTLNQIKNKGILIINPLSTIEWNGKKTYLKELALKGIPILDTLWLSKNQMNGMVDLIQEKGWKNCVIKPVISGGGLNLKRFILDDAPEIIAKCLELDIDEWMLQPFAEEIIDHGELSFIFLKKKYSHAVIKKPAKGNFLVQHIHEGSVFPINPESHVIEQVKKILNRTSREFLFARVDGILRNHQFVVMEIEMIEPYLYYEHCEKSEVFLETFVQYFLDWHNICIQ